MWKWLLVLSLCVLASPAVALDMYHPAVGPPHQGEGSGTRNWSEPPDLNGLIGSSEQILAFGLETELANDFTSDGSGVGHAVWWGGFWNNTTPCQSGITTPGFNLRFYEDAGCVPGTLIADIHLGQGQFIEQSVGCQQGFYPLFKWEGDVNVATVGGDLYWFGAQMADHPFPPQAGRLAAMVITGCDTVFKSAYFSYPDWTPAIDVFGVAFDASQELWQGIPPPDSGACCIGEECRIVGSEVECQSLGGQFQGYFTDCDPNPCTGVPARSSSWGQIKESFR